MGRLAVGSRPSQWSVTDHKEADDAHHAGGISALMEAQQPHDMLCLTMQARAMQHLIASFDRCGSRDV